MSRVTDNLLDDYELGLTLDRYQELLRMPEASFNGLNKPDDERLYACTTIWKQSNRDIVAIAISQAEEKREQEIGFFVAPKWTINEEQPYGSPIVLENKHLRSIGAKTTTTIETGVTLSLGADETDPTDPVVITVTTSVTDASEIKIFYPGESVEIRPSNISISGGVATIKLPRSRLVLPTLNDDREDPLSYYEHDNFLTTVDVKRVYADGNSDVLLVWTSEELVRDGTLCYPDGSEVTQQALFWIRDYRLAIATFYPASSNAGAAFAKCLLPRFVRLSYISGRKSSMSTEMETLRLSHTLMPNKPTSCEAVNQYWEDDNKQHPSNITTPYGSSFGGVLAWISDSRAKVGQQGGMFK